MIETIVDTSLDMSRLYPFESSLEGLKQVALVWSLSLFASFDSSLEELKRALYQFLMDKEGTSFESSLEGLKLKNPGPPPGPPEPFESSLEGLKLGIEFQFNSVVTRF